MTSQVPTGMKLSLLIIGLILLSGCKQTQYVPYKASDFETYCESPTPVCWCVKKENVWKVTIYDIYSATGAKIGTRKERSQVEECTQYELHSSYYTEYQ